MTFRDVKNLMERELGFATRATLHGLVFSVYGEPMRLQTGGGIAGNGGTWWICRMAPAPGWRDVGPIHDFIDLRAGLEATKDAVLRARRSQEGEGI